MSIYPSIIPALLLSAVVLSVACDPETNEATLLAEAGELQGDPRISAPLLAVADNEAHAC